MTLEDAELLHGSDVKNSYGLITRGAGNEISIRRPRESLNRIFMLVSEGT